MGCDLGAVWSRAGRKESGDGASFFLCEEYLGQAGGKEHLVSSKGESSKGIFQTWLLRTCPNPGWKVGFPLGSQAV